MVEILSPATAERDRGLKRELYERQGVREYWIVDPEEDAVAVWRYAGGGEGRTHHERFTERLPVRVGDEVVGEIDLARIFARTR